MKNLNTAMFSPQLQNLRTLLSRRWGKAVLFISVGMTALLLGLNATAEFVVGHLCINAPTKAVVVDLIFGFSVYVFLVFVGFSAYWASHSEANIKIERSKSRDAYDASIKKSIMRLALVVFIIGFIGDYVTEFSTYQAYRSVPSRGVILIGSMINTYLIMRWTLTSMISYVVSHKRYSSYCGLMIGLTYCGRIGSRAKSDMRFGYILIGLLGYLVEVYLNISMFILAPVMIIWCLSVVIPMCSITQNTN